MRLLKLDSPGKFSLTKDLLDEIPPYAILSHTWSADEDEVTFSDLENRSGKSKAGYAKLRFCGEQAKKDGIKHFWVDTCCINRANHVELSEAITSMFRWYRDAVKCYVYLSDVSAPKRYNNCQTPWTWESAFRTSRWNTRGWTLQELLAPASVEFFSREGELLCSKITHTRLIHEITDIPITALHGAPVSSFSVHERLRWAAKRSTKKKEDKAYCLLGIFDVFMPLIYGEGDNAFIRLKEEIDKRLKILDKLPYAKGAMFNSYDQGHMTCHPATRVDLLRQIQDWAQQPHSKSIFWLNGMAGTGKSTISSTIAEWLIGQGRHGVVDLGASFFFKRGEGDRGSAPRLFPTITRNLVSKISGLDTLIADVITSDTFIFDKSLGEQFDKLIYQPLQKVKITSSGCPTLVLVVDALDECEKEGDIKAILDLWSRLPKITTIRLKVFLTSRPDLPIQLGFKGMSVDAHCDMILQDEVPRTTIQHDISVFLKDEFSKIRKEYNDDPPSGVPLNRDWPGDKNLQVLVDMSVPLFIVASTVCRFVGDSNWDAQERLQTVLQYQAQGYLEQMEKTYLPVLTQLPVTLSNLGDEDKLYQEFQMIVGSIVNLADPLSMTSLATLLNKSRGTIKLRLRPLHSVLQVPADLETPIRPLHLSFREFLLSERIRNKPFGIDGPAANRMLLMKCLELLSGPDGLRENLCDLQHPGQPRREVDPAMINARISPAFQYACQYWVYHAQHSMVRTHDDDEVHVFLQKHFLHWLEALSLINKIAEVIRHISVLQSLVSANNSTHLSTFIEDARRVVLANRYIADFAPLQIYSSAMIFAPQTSMVRNICGPVPVWLRRYPITPTKWGPELQKLEGHTDNVTAVAFSKNGSLLASASWDQTVRLWNPTTGQEVQRLDGHTYFVTAVAFSQDGSLLASASWDYTVRLWNPSTGQEVQQLKGHTGSVNAVVFSQDGSLLASASLDDTVRLWNPSTGQKLQQLKGHRHIVNAVAFSQDGSLLASASQDRKVRLWNPTTGQEVQRLKGHTSGVTAVAFSQNGSLLASASLDDTVRLWNPTTGQEIQKLEGHTNGVTAVAFSQDGSLLASASGDQTVRLWNPTTGQEVQQLKGHTGGVTAVAFSQDGSLLASASQDRTVRLWNPTTGQEEQQLDGHTRGVTAVKFSQDGLLLASASQDRTVRLWNPITNQEVQQLKGHTGIVTAVAFSQDGSLLASASYDRTVRLWNLSTGQEVQQLKWHTRTVAAVAFSQDGLLLASASYDRTVKLWNTSTGQEAQALWGHIREVMAVVFSQDGSLLASASGDQTVRLWNPTTGREVQRLEGHTDGVTAVAFSQDSSLLASASDDKTVRVWDRTTGQELYKFEDIPGITTISLTLDNMILLTNRGAINIDNRSIHASALESLRSETSIIKHDWIQLNYRNFLWLPQEYRSCCSAFNGNVFAFGQKSGRISFIQFHT